MSKEKKEFIIQFIKFSIVGISNTVINLIIYYILVLFGMNYILANSIGFIISVINAFYWNNRYVFKEDKDHKNPIRKTLKKIIKVYASYTFTFVLGNVLLFAWVELLNISDRIAPILNLIVTVPINFVMNKVWAFKR